MAARLGAGQARRVESFFGAVLSRSLEPRLKVPSFVDLGDGFYEAHE
jgi:hypothetical protein